MKKITFLIISAFILASCTTTNKIETQPKTTEKTLQNEDDILFEKLKKSLYENNVNLFTETVDETPPIQMRRIINRQDTDGKTLLHRAVLSENFKITKILISAKADENIKDLNGYSPKYYAENARTPKIRELFGFKKNSEQLEIQAEENLSEKKSAATWLLRWLGMRESNSHKRSQSPSHYHYANPHCMFVKRLCFRAALNA